MNEKTAREKAFNYYTSHNGNLIQIGEGIYATNYWAFTLRSNYPQKAESENVVKVTKCESLGEIVIHSSGAIASATPREIVTKRLNKCLKEENNEK